MSEHRPLLTAEEFLEALADLTGGATPQERFIFCGFPGDPNNARTNAWRPRAWRPGDPLPINPHNTNGYVAVSTFGRAPDKTWRRRTDLFVSGRALMVDDVGTKVSREAVAALPPTVRIETSPGNEQWWYFLEQPVLDGDMFGALIRAFIDQRLLAADPGMNGVNRVGRVPGFLNGKAAYGGRFRVRTLEFTPARLFSVQELVMRFGLQLRRKQPVHTSRTDRNTNTEVFIAIFELLQRWNMTRRIEPNAAGWIDIECPWREQHSARAGTGAAVRVPAPENEWGGAFQCHHGHCIDRGWRDLEEWVVETAAENLEQANERADEHPRRVGAERRSTHSATLAGCMGADDG